MKPPFPRLRRGPPRSRRLQQEERRRHADQRFGEVEPARRPGGDWADGQPDARRGFMMGNPSAKVKLIEYGSLSCPHCREFDETGVRR